MTRSLLPQPDGSIALPLPRAAWPAPHLVLLGGLLVLSVLLGLDAAQSMVRTWANTTTYTYGFLIPPIVLWLLWRDRAGLAATALRPEPLALPVLLGASALLLVGGVAGVAVVQQVAVITLLAGSALLALGRAAARRLWFPLGFLYLMVPMGEGLIAPLQDITAAFAVPLVRLLGIPAFRDGVMIATPAGQFEVAEACAGLRFLIANVVLGVLFAHLSYRLWWKKALFLALCVAVPIVANGLRATGIIAVASWTDMRHAVSADHLVYGWGFFTLVMITLLAIGNRFVDPPQPAEAAPAAGAGASRPVTAWLALAALAAVLAGPAYGWAVVRTPDGAAPAAADLPPLAAGWSRQAPGAPAWAVSYPGADRLLADRYASPDAPVDVVVAWYSHQRQGAEVVYHANRPFDGELWQRVRSGSLAVTGNGLPAVLPLDILAGPGGQLRAVVTTYWVDGRLAASPAMAKLLQLKAALTGGEPAAAVVALSVTGDDARPLGRFAAASDLPSSLRALGGR